MMASGTYAWNIQNNPENCSPLQVRYFKETLKFAMKGELIRGGVKLSYSDKYVEWLEQRIKL